MKFILIKREKVIKANSLCEFVTILRRIDLQSWDSNEAFMEGYSFRKKTFENIHLRYDSVNHFIEDLQKNNLLKIEHSKGLLSFFKRRLLTKS